MEMLLQTFEEPIVGRDTEKYRAFVFGRSRPGSTWEGWLVFERLRDGRRFSTGTETTQPCADAVTYWATGLTNAYFDGALERALRPAPAPQPRPVALPVNIDREILRAIHARREPRILTQQLFDMLPFAHADIVRTLERMEEQDRLLVRQTEGGNDWVLLTETGLHAAGLGDLPHQQGVAIIEPPKPRL